jgi:type VI secretion system protein ImpH
MTAMTGAGGVLDDLLAQPHRYEFFQAVRLLQQAGASERLRYRNRLSLGFPPNQIENITAEGEERIRITPAFMGLLGSQGVLPLHYSEGLNRHEKTSNDGGPRAFLDLLSHRATQLFYEAWAMHQPESMAGPTAASTTSTDEDDGFMAILLALAGVASRDGVRRATLARYAAQIRSRNVSAPLLAGMYSEYFDTGVVVEQLVGHWQPLERGHQAQLGRAHVDLGSGVLLGARIYSCDARVRLRIGPLGHDAWERFLPGGSAAAQMAAMLTLHSGAGMTWEVRLIRRADDVRGPRLARAANRLGVDTFMVAGTPQRDREELMYLLHT